MSARTPLFGVLALTVAAAVLPATSAAAAEDRYERDCTHTAGGVPLKVRLTVKFAEAKSDTITRVSVRASDAKETGGYLNRAATVSGVQIFVKGKPGRKLDRTKKSAPYSVAVPERIGKDAFSATATVYWKLTKKRTAEVKCFYLNGSEAES
ncbi:MAG: hypothetical protein ACT4QF_03080 [Sporichthyaceae bacterium]